MEFEKKNNNKLVLNNKVCYCQYMCLTQLYTNERYSGIKCIDFWLRDANLFLYNINNLMVYKSCGNSYINTQQTLVDNLND